jgi:hypothetical protein
MRTLAALLATPNAPARARACTRAACLTLVALASLLAPATAWGGAHGPRYTLKIVAGETTLPEYEQIASTSAYVEPSAQVAVSILRNGTTVYRDVGHGSAWLSQVPQVGDLVTLESPVGTTIGSAVYDGLPSMDATVCAGSTNFSGTNSLGEVVEGFYDNKVLQYNKYGQVTGVHQTAFGEAQVKTLSGTTFGGSFLVPLAPGENVGAVESLKTPLPGEATYTYVSETERPVGGCPPPPPPPYVPPPPPALQGTVLKLARATIHGLLKWGWSDHVGINQPGTVTQNLYAQGGAVPAVAASVHHRHLRPALLLARGSATAKKAGTVTVVLRPTRRGLARLRSAGSLHAVLVTTLHSSSGAKLSLARRYVFIRH